METHLVQMKYSTSKALKRVHLLVLYLDLLKETHWGPRMVVLMELMVVCFISALIVPLVSTHIYFALI